MITTTKTELAEAIDAIADDTRRHALNGEQHDQLRTAAVVLRGAQTDAEWINHPQTIEAKAQWDAVAHALGANGDCPDAVLAAARRLGAQPVEVEPDMLATARRNIRQYLSKASFASEVDRLAAQQCVDVLESAALAARPPACETCNGHGLVGGPSYYAPDEGGEPCPDCSIAARQPVGFDFLAHLQRQREWSVRTFGPGDRAAGVVDHIRKELREIESDPGDLAEWIDVAILALDGAWRSGASAEQIIASLVAKQTRNEGRTWPDWRTADPTKAIEHDRSGEAPPAPAAVPVDGLRDAAIDSALGYLSTALDDLDSSPDRRPGAMVSAAMAALRGGATHPQPAAAKDGDA